MIPVLSAADFIAENARLAAARELARTVSSSHISLSKTYSLLGESLDITSLENEREEEDITEQANDPAAHMRLLKRYLAAEAKNFRELELLVAALEYLELATDNITTMERYMSNIFAYT